ncbi:MAG: hypothetical protein Q8P32_04025 [Candidatus Komeilibacteria bacterium]|nr:hypothetical protein [Candidatus Komeilibacteria bacterium]
MSANQAIALVMGYPMDPVISKLVRTGINQTEAVICCRELLKFLFICVRYPGDWPMMSQKVDAAWHEAILNTPFYFGLCRQLGVGYLHHQPREGFDDPKGIQALYAEFRGHYRYYFGEPPISVWPINIYHATFTAWCCRSSEPLPPDNEGDGQGDGDNTSYQSAAA